MKIRIGPRIRLPVFFGLLLCVLAVGAGDLSLSDVWDGVRAWLPLVAAILCHESGHILTARLCGIRTDTLRVSLFGARLCLSGVISYGRECLIAAAGPLFNLLSGMVCLLALGGWDPAAWGALLGSGGAPAAFLWSSAGLAAINLLPVRSLDGGRVLHCLLSTLCGERVADGVIYGSTMLCLGFLWCFSVYALLRVGEMLTLFAFSLCLMLRMTDIG